MDVRGRPYLNLGVLTEAVCRLPGVSGELLGRVGLDLPLHHQPASRAGPLDGLPHSNTSAFTGESFRRVPSKVPTSMLAVVMPPTMRAPMANVRRTPMYWFNTPRTPVALPRKAEAIMPSGRPLSRRSGAQLRAEF